MVSYNYLNLILICQHGVVADALDYDIVINDCELE